MAHSGPVEDRLAIRELIDSYHEAVALNDAQAWIANWAEDARWDLGEGTPVQGRAAILQHWQDAMARFDFVGMAGAPGSMQVDGDAASATWLTNEICRTSDGKTLRICGRYEDRYRRIAGSWKIAERSYRILFLGNPLYPEDEPDHWR